MEEETKQKIYERVGVVLFVVVLILIGIILIKDKDEQPAKFVPAPEKPVTRSGTTVKAAEDVKTGKVSINKGSVEDLDRLPGIGAVLAQRIIDYRIQNGSFKTLEEIKNVSGIGDAKYNNIKDLIGL